jgi:hypothetical protein
MSKSKGRGKASGRDGGKEREWRGVIDEQRESGSSVRAFCRGRGLREASFYRWRREIRLRDRDTAHDATTSNDTADRSPVLAPVVVIDESFGVAAQGSQSASAIEIVLGGGTTVRVPPDSTHEQLDMVLSVLERTRC